MTKRIFLVFTMILSGFSAFAQEKPLRSGMFINKSTRIRKAVYKIDAPADTSQHIIVIEGDNIIIDFNNAELRGSNKMKDPDGFFGVAVVIRNSRNVAIKNLRARGFKVALLASNTEKLSIENCDFSYNYRQHLNSTQEKEDVSDWMSYHHNEKDEWLRYGAAMYLKESNFFTVKNCKVTGGQNALMMMQCNDGLIVNNDFSFNSGIGIGMYRSNRTSIMYNRLIFNIRGYSHGVYNRGQDSAGILIYEQSSDNQFYYNNVTHGGDGFFLWAGQYTMDTGKGGCNNNILFGNDFSYASNNGIEATFSSNYFSDNRMFECDYGIWGGYSFNTTIRRNQFRDNRIAIAIEHGQRNLIENNIFSGDKTGIRLWANKLEPSDWGYPKYRDTRSAAYNISLNSFNNNPLVFNLSRSDSLWIHNNTYNGDWANYFKIDSTVVNLDSLFDPFPAGSSVVPVVFAATSKWPFDGSGKFKGRQNIMITEWGPYDFRYPLIWNTNPTSKSDTMEFELLGPKGKWSLISLEGGDFPYVEQVFREPKKVMYDQTDLPQKIVFIKHTGPGTGNDSSTDNTELVMEFRGSSFTDQFGNIVPANKPVKVKFQKFFQPILWEVLFYSLDTAFYNPIKTGMLFSPTERKAPFKTEKVNKLDYAWWGGIKEGPIQHKQFITMASGHAKIAKGVYELSVTWDDAVRVYVDEKLLIDEWNPSKYNFDESPHKKVRLELDGNHQFRVEHLELGGFAALSLKIKPVE